MQYYKDITRLDYSLFDVKAWHNGEGDELKKLIDFGFFNTIFVSVNGNVTVYYEKEECDEFYKVLDEILNEELFNDVCDSFVDLISIESFPESNDEIFDLTVKLWPHLTILDIVSKYPEYGTESMIRRLIRLRKSTDSFSYDLTNNVDCSEKEPDCYIFYKGEVFEGDFEEFINQKGFEVI